VLSVIDIANSGTLVEGTVRLLPGTRIDAHVVTRTGRVLARSRVVRAFVAALSVEGIRYRVALSFDPPIDASPPGYAFPGPTTVTAPAAGNDYPVALPGAAECP
jgi:hypothetical protein